MSDNHAAHMPPTLDFGHGLNGVYHISPEDVAAETEAKSLLEQVLPNVDFADIGINVNGLIAPEDVAAEKVAEEYAKIHQRFPFLEGIPIEALQIWHEEWRSASATEGGRSMTMLQFIDQWAERDDDDVVPGVFPRGEVLTIAAESGGGKSYLGCKTFATCLTGGLWWGRWPVGRLTPLYCLTEDQKGWSKRLLAHLNDAGWEPGDHMGYVRNDLPRLLESGNYNRNTSGGYEWFLRIRADQYRGELPDQIDVLFIDYLRDAAPGADEQSNNDMSLVMDGANQLARALNLLLVLMHHRGANSDKATRGATVVVDKSYAVFVLTGKLIPDEPKAVVKIEAAKSPKGTARPSPILFRLNGESGNTPVVNFVAGGEGELADELYQLLRSYPGKRLSITQLQNELDRPDEASAEAWKQRVIRAGKAIWRDKVKYPGVDYVPGRSGGYAYLSSERYGHDD